MKSNLKKIGLILAIIFSRPLCADQLPVPVFSAVDKFGINLLSGQVTKNIETVGIGGALGISHSLRIDSSSLLVKRLNGPWIGPSDKFGGEARVYNSFPSIVPAGQTVVPSDLVYVDALSVGSVSPQFLEVDSTFSSFTSPRTGVDLMHVSDPTETARFKIARDKTYTYAGKVYTSVPISNAYQIDAQLAYQGAPWTDKYRYEALGDKRHTLSVITAASGRSQLLWTKPDGTRVYFDRGVGSPTPTTTGRLDSIVYPNGLTLTFTKDPTSRKNTIYAVSNTGFALKYNYVRKSNSPVVANLPNDTPNVEDYSWSISYPSAVLAFNAAIVSVEADDLKIYVGQQDSCPSFDAGLAAPSDKQTCVKMDQNWPTAKFSWPAGMPYALFHDQSDVVVTNAANQNTTLHIKAFDKYTLTAGASFNQPAYPINTNFEPRIESIKVPGATDNTYSYTYKNYQSYDSVEFQGAGWIYATPGDVGVIGTAKKFNEQMIYSPGVSWGSFPLMGVMRTDNFLTVIARPGLLGGIYNIESVEKLMYFEANYRNLPTTEYSGLNPRKTYHYDTRGNLDRIDFTPASTPSSSSSSSTSSSSSSGAPVLAASSFSANYPTACVNIKTCNQPLWTKDANGNQTDYTYDGVSGQIATITYPANNQSVRAKIRNKYDPYYAKYFGAKGDIKVKDFSGAPVYLKTSTSTCANSVTNTDDSCAGGDEVRTTYEYKHDNLLLTGKVDYAQLENKSLRTCYRYDIYGNKIGETQPQANLASCE